MIPSISLSFHLSDYICLRDFCADLFRCMCTLFFVICFFSFRLADLAAFHQYISQNFNLTHRNTWISFGGSYSGALSAWFRGKVQDMVYIWKHSKMHKASNFKIQHLTIFKNQSYKRQRKILELIDCSSGTTLLLPDTVTEIFFVLYHFT